MGLVVAAVLGGCTGEVTVKLTDPTQSVPGETVALTAAYLPIDTMEARKEGEEWEAIEGGFDPYNLLDFSGGPFTVDLFALRESPAVLAYDELPRGELTGLRIRLGSDPLLVTTPDGLQHPAIVPAGTEAALVFDVRRAIESGGEVEVTLAMDARASFTEVGGNWVFAPAVTVED